jgi:hypothetical protein
MRASGMHRRRPRSEHNQRSANATAGLRLPSRGHGRTGHGGTARPHPQYSRQLQDCITSDLDSGDESAAQNLQAEHHTHKTAAESDHDLDIEEIGDDINYVDDDPNEIDDFAFCESQLNNINQDSALFYDSQLTQLTIVPNPPPVLSAFIPRPIRIVSQRPHDYMHTRPKRPVKTYRGKDPIKRVVSNKKLQAIFAGKPIPKERKKYRDERMELRMGESRVLK